MSSKYVTTPQKSLSKAIWGIVGPPGEGKSFLALTASQRWPRPLAIQPSELVLDDIVYACHDQAGLVGLAPYRVRPDVLIDMASFVAEEGAANGHVMLKNLLSQVIKKGQHKVLVVDTVSTLASDISTEVWAKPDTSSQGAIDGIATNKRVRESILRWFVTYEQIAAKCDMRLLLLFHPKYAGDFAMDGKKVTIKEDGSPVDTGKTMAEMKRDASGEDGNVSIDVVGSAKGIMVARCSEILSVQKKAELRQGQRIVTRSVRFGLEGWNLKNRLARVFDATKDYPADLLELFKMAEGEG